jgi:uncharacterized protein (TIGR03643 family)
MKHDYPEAFVKEIIRLAWADDVSFEKIKRDKGLSEADVVVLMRRNLNPGLFRKWRKFVSGRPSKHEKRTRLFNTYID